MHGGMQPLEKDEPGLPPLGVRRTRVHPGWVPLATAFAWSVWLWVWMSRVVTIRPSSPLFGPFSIFLVCAFLSTSFGTLRFLRGMAHFYLLHYNSCKI